MPDLLNSQPKKRHQSKAPAPQPHFSTGPFLLHTRDPQMQPGSAFSTPSRAHIAPTLSSTVASARPRTAPRTAAASARRSRTPSRPQRRQLSSRPARSKAPTGPSQNTRTAPARPTSSAKKWGVLLVVLLVLIGPGFRAAKVLMWHVFEPQSSSSSAALSTASDKNKASDFNSEVRSGITPRAAGAPDLTTTPVHVNPNVWLDPRYANGTKKVDLGGEFLAADSQHRTALIFSPHGGELVVDIATQKPALTLSDNVFCEGLVAYGDRVPCIESLAKRQSLLLLDLATRQIRTLATWDLKGDASYLTRVVAIDTHRIYTTSEIRSTTLAAYDIASGKRLWTQRTPLRYPECTVLSGHLGCWDKSGKSTIIEVRDHNTGLPTMNLSLPSNARFNWLWDGLVADNGAKNNTTLYSLSGATVGTLKGDSFPTQFTNNKLFESASVHSNPSVLHTSTTSDGTLLYWSRSGRTYLYPTQQEFRSLEATGNTADGALFSAVSRDGNASRTLIISKKGTLLTTINEKLKPMCGLLVGSDFHTVYLPIADSAS